MFAGTGLIWLQVAVDDIRLYYTCGGRENNTNLFLCVATSKDGITFTKPFLNLIDYNGTKQNNIVFVTPYGPGGHKGTGWGNTVVLDSNPRAKPSERFLLTFDTDRAPYEDRQMLVAVSADGFHFQLNPAYGHGLGGGFGDTQTVLYYNSHIDRSD